MNQIRTLLYYNIIDNSETDKEIVSLRKDGKVQKMLVSVDHEDIVEILKTTISQLKKHVRRKWVQAAECNTLKDVLKENDSLRAV